MTIWYKNYFGNTSQPWARQVQKEIDNQKAAFQTAEVNNVKRDAQLGSSLRQVQAAATAASQAAIDAAQAAQDAADANSLAITANNTAISANSTAITANSNALAALQDVVDLANPAGPTINAGNVTAGTMSADRISGGTIDGLTITGGSLNTTASGGKSVQVTGSSAYFRYNGSYVGEATADSVGRLLLSGNSGLYLNGGASGSGHFGSGGFYIYDGGVLSASGALTRTQLIGGGTTGASVTNGGNFVRTSSSQRYKTDIQLLDIDLNDLYTLQPKTFKRIDEVEEDGENARVYPGLIAEELAGTSLDKFVFYSEDEEGNPRPEGIHYPELTAALLLAIKDLNNRITELENRVE